MFFDAKKITGKVFTYARVSTEEQKLDVQRDALKEFCDHNNLEAIAYEEKKSGTTMESRTELNAALKAMGKGDLLVVVRLDRLARSTFDACKILEQLKEKGADITALDGSIDTTSPMGEAMFKMASVFAEMETKVRKERQTAGIEKRKQERDKKGLSYHGKERRKKVEPELILKTLETLSMRKTAEHLGCSLSTVQRAAKQAKQGK